MPTARLGAPPVRESSVDSPISRASASAARRDREAPLRDRRAAALAVAPSVAGPTFIAK